VPCFDDIPTAVAVLSAIRASQARATEPAPSAIRAGSLPPASLGLLTAARAAGHPTVSEIGAKEILAAAGITVPAELRATAGPLDEQLAKSGLRLPVVAKLVSADLAHKSEVGAVRVGLSSPADVEEAVSDLRDLAAELKLGTYEVIVQEQIPRGTELLLGMQRDPSFGPVLVLGHGGILAEALGDVAVAIPPLIETDVSRLLAVLGHPRLTAGYRGLPPADTESVRAAVTAFSRLVLALPEWVESVDVNPLISAPDGRAVAVDALFTL
jgi:acetyltransferase